MNSIYRLRPTYNPRLYEALTQNDMPPTLYALMNSIVNYNRETKIRIEDLPAYAKDEIFNFNYPLDDNLKPHFEETFLTHFMMRRIGFETFTAFKLNLKAKLNEIMPRYNYMLDGFSNLDFDGNVEEHIRTEKNVSTNELASNITTENINDNRYSDTPENKLTDVQNGDYMTDYTYNKTNGSTNNTSNGKNNLDTEENIKIIKKDSIEEYEKFLKIATDVYSMIFNELDILFYQLPNI